MTALREAALAAIASRLTSEMPTVTVERARRAPVDTDVEVLPKVILTAGDVTADESQEPGYTHYTIGFSVHGFVTADTDLELEQAQSELHGSVQAALAGWTPNVTGLGTVEEQEGQFVTYDIEESARPASTFQASFTILAIGQDVALLDTGGGFLELG